MAAPNPNLARSAIVFDIQRFSLHDGPGIRTTIFFKGCPIRCTWCQNPESHKTRPEIAFYAEQCQESFRCASVCPNDAILTTGPQRVDYSKCSGCGDCALACNFDALRLIGRSWSATALLNEILKDKDYFFDSGGGVTLSGGEPMLQAPFLQTFLPRVQEHDIHVTLETCGVFKWQAIARVLPYLDLIYYDLKHMNSAMHKKYTGVDNRLILDNFAKLAAVFPGLQARMPVIPGINDDREHVVAVARFLKQNGHAAIHCLPYHDFGKAKLPRIDSDLQPLQLTSSHPGDLQPVQQIFKEEGIDVTIYD